MFKQFDYIESEKESTKVIGKAYECTIPEIKQHTNGKDYMYANGKLYIYDEYYHENHKITEYEIEDGVLVHIDDVGIAFKNPIDMKRVLVKLREKAYTDYLNLDYVDEEYTNLIDDLSSDTTIIRGQIDVNATKENPTCQIHAGENNIYETSEVTKITTYDSREKVDDTTLENVQLVIS